MAPVYNFSVQARHWRIPRRETRDTCLPSGNEERGRRTWRSRQAAAHGTAVCMFFQKVTRTILCTTDPTRTGWTPCFDSTILRWQTNMNIGCSTSISIREGSISSFLPDHRAAVRVTSSAKRGERYSYLAALLRDFALREVLSTNFTISELALCLSTIEH